MDVVLCTNLFKVPQAELSDYSTFSVFCSSSFSSISSFGIENIRCSNQQHLKT